MPAESAEPLLPGSVSNKRKGRLIWPYVAVISLLVVVGCVYGLAKLASVQTNHAQDDSLSAARLQNSMDVLQSTELADVVWALQLNQTVARSKLGVMVMKTSLDDALQHLTSCSGLVVVVTGMSKPQRRTPEQPFLRMDPPGLLTSLADAINDGAAKIEAALGRQLFAMHVVFTDRLRALAQPMDSYWAHLEGADAAGCGSRPFMRPYAVFEVATGTLLLDDGLVAPLLRAAKGQAMLVSTAVSVMGKIAEAARTVTAMGSASAVALVSAAAAAGATAAFASTVPMWFCLACPIVLGLLAPLLVNAGLGEAADIACKALSLDATECFDLFLGALGVGVLLAMLCAFPIFKVCKLYECAHPMP